MTVPERIEATLALLQHGEPVFACRHLVAPQGEAPPMTQCLQHPATGILCVECQQAHVERHDLDRPCDFCGEPAEQLLARSVELVVPAVPVRHPKLVGAEVLLSGTLHLVGVVVCPACTTPEP